MKRIVDLTMVAARELGYIGKGLAKVKVEVIEKPKGKSKPKKKAKPLKTNSSKAAKKMK